MWYETLLPLGIVGVCLALPQAINYATNVWLYGNPYRRKLEKKWEYSMYVRDMRITNGKPWDTPGLDAIPDK